jgi:hypothetical protein
MGYCRSGLIVTIRCDRVVMRLLWRGSGRRATVRWGEAGLMVVMRANDAVVRDVVVAGGEGL